MSKHDNLIYSRGLTSSDVSAHGSLGDGHTVIKLKSPVPSGDGSLNLRRSNIPVIPFFTGYNDFADLLSLALEISPVHAACVQSKARYSVGDGFDLRQGQQGLVNAIIQQLKKAVGIPDAKRKAIADLLINCNDSGHDLFDIAYRCFYDLYSGGNAYIQLIRGTLLGKKFFNIWHHRFNTVLLETPSEATGVSEACYVSPHWRLAYLTGRFTPERVGMYPNWTQRDDGTETCMIHVSEYNARHDDYGLPQSVANLLYVSLDYKIPKANGEEFDNGFNPSALVEFIGNMGKEEGEKFLNEFQKTFTGENNGSRIFARIIPDSQLQTRVNIFDKKNQGQYIELDKTVTQKILTSHSWHPKLAGIMYEGQLGGDSQELRNAWEIAENTVIKFARKPIGRQCNIAITEKAKWLINDAAAADWYLDFISTMPMSFLGDVDVNGILTVNEAREQWGAGPLTDKNGNEVDRGFDRIHLDTRANQLQTISALKKLFGYGK